MQPDIWEEWWRPACVLDMQPAMWSTRCRRACVRSHAERHTGCHQPEADWLVSPINTPRPQLISSHPDLSKQIIALGRFCPTEGQSSEDQIRWESSQRGYRERERKEVIDSRVWSILKTDTPPRRPVPSNRRFSTIVTRKLCPIQFVQAMEVLPRVSSEPRVQISRSSARYSAGSPKNCPEARGGSVRVQISLSRPVNFFMVKPRLCPRQDQSIPVQSRRPLGFGQVFSDQPAASRLEHCELVPVIFKDSFSAGGWTIWVTLVVRVLGHIGRTTGTIVCRQYVRDPPILGLCRGELVFLQTSYPAGSRKPLIRWIGKTQRDGVMAYG
ncbi:hypothetical protein IGI04_042689 [Brassica rapa subsp. trilocularis]|uniref:Ig-like domain-containing protein n=1 Tax=Brassica rapa subsp. trilocularis TaxID=1813537 RepID=A0ABQ7KLZ0_BRACM|nr:hypothetical protein IGI04_042689 [Brassica rapa subsp. trilocularis]